MIQRPAILLCFPLILFSVALHAQVPAAKPDAVSEAPSKSTVIKVNSRLVVLDVVARTGQSTVAGLKKDDFHVTENGVPQVLVSFEEHVGAGKPSAPLHMPPHVYTNYRAPGTGAVAVILLDALNTPQKDQMYVRQQMLSFLKDIPPNIPFAVFTLGSQLRLLQPFTTDPTQLIAAIKSSRATPTVSPLLPDPNEQRLSDFVSDLSTQGPGGQMQSALPPDYIANLQEFEAEQDVFNYEFRVKLTMSALTQIAAYVQNENGRKDLIWVSGAFPAGMLPNADLGKNEFNTASDQNGLIAETSALLTNSRISVYPIDARGLMTSPVYDASNNPTSHYVQRSNLNTADMQFSVSLGAEHAAMSAVAEQTGGRAFFNTNGIKEAMESATLDGAHYYTVTYVPTNSTYDGKVRHISVKVSSGRYDLNYRRSYIATDPNAPHPREKLAGLDPLHAAFNSGAPDTSEILFDVKVNPREIPAGSPPAGTVEPDWKGPVNRYAVDFAVEGRDIHPETQPDGNAKLDLEFVAIGYDEWGREVNAVSQHVTSELTPERAAQLAKSGVPFHAEIDLPVKMVFLRVGVAEEASGRSGTVEIPLVPTSTKAK